MIIIGHRGAAGEAPENTLSGFRLALQNHVTDFELDLHLSKDGQLVVLHDPSLKRTTGVKGYVGNFTAEELAMLDARHSFSGWPEFQGIPTLESVLRMAPEASTFQLEVKVGRRTLKPDLIVALTRLFSQNNLYERATVTSSDHRFLRALVRHAPTISIGYVAQYHFPDPVRQASKLGCKLLVANKRLVNDALIKKAKQAGLGVSVWTINTLEDAEQMKSLGVDSVITNYPTKMKQHFGE